MIDLDLLQREAEADGCRPVVGALILDRRGRVFVQRRGPDRAFLPNGWDLVGGHVEAGESLLEALQREVAEETGWTVIGEPQLVFVGDWRTDPADPSSARREFDFLVDVDGDLDRPRLEWPKHTESRWMASDDIPRLDENRGRDDGLVRHLAELALRSARHGRLSYPHGIVFPDSAVAEPIERLRRRWDPAMASQIAAHVTVVYPEEVNSVDHLVDRVRDVGEVFAPLELRLGRFAHRPGRSWWVGLDAIDRSEGWRHLRELIVPAERRRADVGPHVTIVHPRHSNLGAQAWEAVRERELAGRFTVHDIVITVFDGRRWQEVERVALTGASRPAS